MTSDKGNDINKNIKGIYCEIEYAAASDTGKVRGVNEDYFKVIEGNPLFPLAFIIADGMGGHNAGEIASMTAVESAYSYLSGSFKELTDVSDIRDRILMVFRKANTEVFNNSLVNNETAGMGTTLLMAVIKDNEVFIGNIGDSRAYVMRNGELKRLTVDHSYVEELVRKGSLTREEAERHPRRNVLTRAVGCDSEVEADIIKEPAGDRDVFLLCTDGLTNMVPETLICRLLVESPIPEEACKKLIMYANENGGADNITVIVFSKDRRNEVKQ
ncbi:MAG: Stp1/IreP family PP2C-type Ser/Thr phosphatase [Eubacteriales bacterium]|nr:Stp1/IreP family PP2C-type Ser/Thr phosphatase [Eubacteriales bacterium]